MTGKLLQVMGVLAILGLVGAAFAGFAVLKDRVRIVVQADDDDVAADPVALLRDDVQVLARDVAALQQAIAENFGQLANGLEDRANERHADVRALRQQSTAMASELQAMRARLQQLQMRVDALPQATAAAAAAMAPAATVAQPATMPDAQATEQPLASEPVAEPPAAVVSGSAVLEPSVVEAPVVAEPEPAPKQGTGFLSFTLPSSKLAFDEPQDYVLLPQLCRVGFDAKSTLHDFTGVTSAVTGRFRANWADPEGLCTGSVAARAGALKTGVDGRDSNMWQYLDVEQHPEIQFTIERFAPAAGGVDVAARKARGEVLGKMTIRGKTRDLRLPVTVAVDPQQRVVIEGQTRLLLSDYDVPVPSQLGVINMQDEVVVWLALRARAQVGEGDRSGAGK